MEFERITSRQNERVKRLVKLKERKGRENEGRFVVEGFREISHALKSGIIFEELWICPKFFRSHEFHDLVQSIGTNIQATLEVSEEVFEKISHREGPDGLLVVAKERSLQLSDIKLPNNPLLLVVEAVEKPGNLGALIRSAEAAGVDALIVTDPVIDIYNPQVIRSSQGLVFALPIVVCTNEAALEFLQKHKIQVLATTPQAQTHYWDVDLASASAVAVGSEKDGLTDFWLKNKEVQTITIPMPGHADSLNVNSAATIVLFEAVRQRFKR